MAAPPIMVSAASVTSDADGHDPMSRDNGSRGAASHEHVTWGQSAPSEGRWSGDVAECDEFVEDEEARQYEVLMDDLAAHSVIIRKGEVLDTTPEYESFRRTCGDAWPAVAGVLVQLEAICVQYAVPLATVGGRAVLALGQEVAEAAAAAGGGPPPPPLPAERLLACIENIQEVAAVLQRPGQRFRGPHGLAAAVVLIQAFTRGAHARRRAMVLRKKHTACRVIQGEWRVLRMRQHALRRIANTRAHRAEQFADLQASLRSSWDSIRESHRVIIHLPGVAPSATVADGSTAALDGAQRPLPSMRALETAQLPRLCDVADPLTDVVFVVAKPLPADVHDYWARLLEAGGVPAPASARFTVVHAENAGRLPQRMPLAAKVLASPRAMHRLTAAAAGRSAFIMPGGVGDADIELSVALGVPLLGALPAFAAAVASKSGARALLRQARVNVPPGVTVPAAEPAVAASAPELVTLATGAAVAAGGALQGAGRGVLGGMEVAEREAWEAGAARSGVGSTVQLKFTLAEGRLDVAEAAPPPPRRERKDRLLCEHVAAAMLQPGTKHTRRWFIKLEDEPTAAGMAFFDAADVRGLPAARTDALHQLTTARRAAAAAATAAADVAAPAGAAERAAGVEEQRLAAVQQLAALLLRDLRAALRMVVPAAYPTYRAFVQAVRERGAVVEAAPAQPLGAPSVSLLVQPDGAAATVATVERIFAPAYVCIGHAFPQASVTPAALADAAAAVGTQLAQAGFMGHATIDFAVLHDPHTMLRLWATDISVGPSPALAAFQLFDFLCAGDFNPRAGTYALLTDAASTVDTPTGPLRGADGSTRSSMDGGNGPSTVGCSSTAGDGAKQRCYVSCELLRHPALPAAGYNTLLRAFRVAGAGFDVATRTGAMLALTDTAAAGAVGTVLAAAESPAAAMRQSVAVMELMDDTMAASVGLEKIPEATGFRSLIAALQYLAQQLDPHAQHG
eukprot:jgi/Ulvmu1/11760/UM008_0174.1